MVDYAALVADSAFPSRVNREIGRSLFERAIGRLTAETRDDVLKLARSGDEDGSKQEKVNVEDVVRTNSFTISVGAGSYMVLFPRIAVCEHVLGLTNEDSGIQKQVRGNDQEVLAN